MQYASFLLSLAVYIATIAYILGQVKTAQNNQEKWNERHMIEADARDKLLASVTQTLATMNAQLAEREKILEKEMLYWTRKVGG